MCSDKMIKTNNYLNPVFEFGCLRMFKFNKIAFYSLICKDSGVSFGKTFNSAFLCILIPVSYNLKFRLLCGWQGERNSSLKDYRLSKIKTISAIWKKENIKGIPPT